MRLLLKGAFVFSSLIKRGSVIECMDVAVGGGIHFLVIKTIENAEQAITARTQQVIKLLAKGWSENLLGIALNDCGYSISKQDAASHYVDDVG